MLARRLYFVLLLLIGPLPPRVAQSQEGNKNLVERGQYIFAVAGGCACHTVPGGTPNVGGRAFPIPFGTVYATNITADKETGLGSWSDQEILNAMTRGIRSKGERLLPVMPHEAYSGIAKEDLEALLVPLWLKLFGRYSTPPAKAPRSGVERGRYLADHISLCGDCHTPRNFLGVPNRALYLAGMKVGPLGDEISNITPDKKTGIGEWSRDEIARLTLTGFKPNLDNVQGLMEEVIGGVSVGYKNMTREDALAIADYLKSIRPIVNRIN
jgi:mono/diheme cytochrome c family protein